MFALKYPFPMISAPIPISKNSFDSPRIKNSPMAISTAPSITAYRYPKYLSAILPPNIGAA